LGDVPSSLDELRRSRQVAAVGVLVHGRAPVLCSVADVEGQPVTSTTADPTAVSIGQLRRASYDPGHRLSVTWVTGHDEVGEGFVTARGGSATSWRDGLWRPRSRASALWQSVGRGAGDCSRRPRSSRTWPPALLTRGPPEIAHRSRQWPVLRGGPPRPGVRFQRHGSGPERRRPGPGAWPRQRRAARCRTPRSGVVTMDRQRPRTRARD
jgi:hypothetical protein